MPYNIITFENKVWGCIKIRWEGVFSLKPPEKLKVKFEGKIILDNYILEYDERNDEIKVTVGLDLDKINYEEAKKELLKNIEMYLLPALILSSKIGYSIQLNNVKAEKQDFIEAFAEAEILGETEAVITIPAENYAKELSKKLKKPVCYKKEKDFKNKLKTTNW